MRRSTTFLAFASATGLIASTLVGGCGDDETTSTTSSTTSGPTSSTVSSTTDTSVSVSSSTAATSAAGGTGGTGGSMGGAGGSMGGAGGSMGGAGGSMGGSGGGLGGSGGTGGGVLPANEAAFFWGDFATNGVQQVGSAVFPGPVVTPFSLDGLMTGNDITSVAVSPDGMTIAVSGRDTSTSLYVLNLYNAASPGLATNLVTGANTSVDITDAAFSPDGQWIAFRMDATVSGANELWVVPSAGGTAKRVSQAFSNSANDVEQFAWQPDVSGNLKYIAYRADPVDTVSSLFTVEITASTPAPVDVVPEAVIGQTVSPRVPQFDAQGNVYFVGDFVVDNVFQLFQADINGMNRVQVPGSVLMNGNGEASMGQIGMSPDGTQIAFSVDAPTANLFQFYVLDLATTTPVQVSTVPTTFLTFLFQRPIAWSPDGTMLAVMSDFPVNADANPGDLSAFILPTSGTPGGVRVVKVPQGTNQDIDQVGFTANSAQLFMLGDVVVANDTSLYATADFTTADQTASSLLVQGVAASGDISAFVISP